MELTMPAARRAKNRSFGQAIAARCNKAVIVYGQQVVTVHHCEHSPRSWRRLA